MNDEDMAEAMAVPLEFPMPTHDLALSSAARRTMVTHVEKAYPEEGCGFLIGPAPVGTELPGRIERALPEENFKETNRTHRFLIPADEVARVEHSLAGTGRAILGYYHSHPDHPAIPSAFDRDHAWPWYVYIVIAVEKAQAKAIHGFQLDPDREGFSPRALSPTSNSNDSKEEMEG